MDHRGGPGPPVHRGPIQGIRPPFDLGRPCPSHGPGRMWATGGGETVGAGSGAVAAHRRPRRRWRFGRYGALFATRFEQGERGGRRGAHQRLVDDGGAA
jgi:hypothetical protein